MLVVDCGAIASICASVAGPAFASLGCAELKRLSNPLDAISIPTKSEGFATFIHRQVYKRRRAYLAGKPEKRKYTR
jgi:hypothetical protein